MQSEACPKRLAYCEGKASGRVVSERDGEGALIYSQIVASKIYEAFVLEVSSRFGLGLVDGDDWEGK